MPSTSQAGHRTVTRYSIDALLIDCSGEVPADVLHAIDTGVPQVSESHCGDLRFSSDLTPTALMLNNSPGSSRLSPLDDVDKRPTTFRRF